MILKLWVLKLDLASPRFSPTIPVFVNHLQTLILKTEAKFNSILYAFGTLLITETETPLRPPVQYWVSKNTCFCAKGTQ